MRTHILNGDALFSRFPKQISGDSIIFRECLIEGPIEEEDIDSFLYLRGAYLSERYPEANLFYIDDVRPQLVKIENIEKTSEINLWFEDDLFCQMNMWYILSRLKRNRHQGAIYIVRPQTDLRFGFGACDEPELVKCLHSKQLLSQDSISILSGVWSSHREKNKEELIKTKNVLTDVFPFVSEAIHALLYHHYVEQSHVVKTLKEIIKEKNSKELKEVFPAFSKKMAIYGLGDLQVQRLIEDIDEQTM